MQYDHEYAYNLIDERNNSDNRRRPYFCERYARDPDVSGSWREECRAVSVDPDGHELLTDGGHDPADRPDDCICWDDTAALPCFPCAREGFDTPNDDPPEHDTDVDAYPATVDST
jgi:hypothetical protein